MKKSKDGQFIRTWIVVVSINVLLLCAIGLFLGESPAAWEEVAYSPAQTFPAYMKEIDFLKYDFSEQFEVLGVVFHGDSHMKGFAVTTKQEDRISIAESFIIEEINRRGKALKDVYAVVHNHNDPSGFSEQDDHLYYYLRRQGFDGHFLIYYPHSGTVLEKK